MTHSDTPDPTPNNHALDTTPSVPTWSATQEAKKLNADKPKPPPKSSDPDGRVSDEQVSQTVMRHVVDGQLPLAAPAPSVPPANATAAPTRNEVPTPSTAANPVAPPVDPPVVPTSEMPAGSGWTPSANGGPVKAPSSPAGPAPSDQPSDPVATPTATPTNQAAPTKPVPPPRNPAGRGYFDITEAPAPPAAAVAAGAAAGAAAGVGATTADGQPNDASPTKRSKRGRGKSKKAEAPPGPVSKDLADLVVTTSAETAFAQGERDSAVADDSLTDASAGIGVFADTEAADKARAKKKAGDDQKRLMVLLGILGALLLGIGGFMLFGGDDEAEVASTEPTTTTVAGATTTTVAGAPAPVPGQGPTTTKAGGAAAPTPDAGSIQVAFLASGAQITGKVPNEEIKTQMLGGATLLFQPGLVDGAAVTVDPGAPELNPNEDPVIRSLGEPVLQGVGAIGVILRRGPAADVVVIGGTVNTQLAKDRIVGAVAGVAGGLDKVIVELEITDPAAAGATTTAPAAPAPPAAGASTTAPAAPGSPGATTPPAPAPGAPAAVQNELDALLKSKIIEFPSGSTSLTAQWVAAVDQVAEALRGNDAKVQIAGHSDGRGDPAVNLRLSLDRAESIKAALVQRGIAADRLSTTGYGQARPIADNATDAGRQRNRRIEFVVAAR